MESLAGGPTVMFADGIVSEPVSDVVNMNDWLKGYVVEGLDKSLISVRDITKQGKEVLFTSGGGVIRSNSGLEEVKIHLVDDQFYVDLNDLETIPGSRKFFSKTKPVNAYLASMSVGEQIKDLHERMGHAHPLVMARALDGKEATWRNAGVTSEQIRRYYSDSRNRCLCHLSYANRPKKAVRVSEVSKVPAEVISADPIFKIYPESYDKDLGAFLFADEATGFLHVFVGRHKSQFFDCLKIVERWYRSWNCSMKYLQTDLEAVVMSKDISEWCLNNHIHQRQSVPYEHWQNFVERDVQSFNKGVAALMNDQKFLSAKYWPLAAFHWVDIHNHTPNANTGGLTPWELVTKEKTTLSNQFLFKFGEPVCVPVVTPDKLWRFDAKNDIGIYVGQPHGVVGGGSILFPWSGKLLVRGSLSKVTANFDEINRWIGIRNEMMNGNLAYGQLLVKLVDELNQAKERLERVYNGKDIRSTEPVTVSGGGRRVEGMNHEVSTGNRINPRRKCREFANYSWIRGSHNISDERLMDAIDIVLNEGMLYPDKIQVNNTEVMDPWTQFMAMKVNVRTERNPTVRKAMISPEHEGWKNAMIDEWNLLTGVKDGRTRSLSERIVEPDQVRKPGEQVIRSTWQLQEKLNKDGIHEKFKARCCASGDMLKGVIQETFSPTVNSLTCILLQNIALIDDMVEASADVVGAYLYSDYPQDKPAIYLTLEDHVADILGEPRGCWYRILKYLYGLPDAGKAFYEMYRDHLIVHEYMPTISDPCLFHKVCGEKVTYIWIHVDDTYVCGSSQKQVNLLFDALRIKFEITTKEVVDSYIGIKHERLAGGDLKMTQPKLLNKLFKSWEINEENKDMYPSKQYISERLKAEKEPIDRIMYLTLLGGLIYMLKTRPDIGFAVSNAATKSTNPDTIDWLELKTILHYLYNTRTYGLVLEHLPKGSKLVLETSVDASYLTHKDSHSHTSYNLKFGSKGTCYSKSMKQSTVATSSTHAETIACFTLIKDIIFVECICNEIGRPIELPVTILEDNDALITLMNQDGGISKRTKHFLMLIHYCREQVRNGLVRIEHVDSEKNIADIGSKAIFGQDFKFKRQGLLGLQEGEVAVQPLKRPRKVTFNDVID